MREPDEIQNDPVCTSDTFNAESARSPHVPANQASSLKIEKVFLDYEELLAKIGCKRRTAERLLSKGVIQKIPGIHPAQFYWPDVLAGLRSQKGYKRYAD